MCLLGSRPEVATGLIEFCIYYSRLQGLPLLGCQEETAYALKKRNSVLFRAVIHLHGEVLKALLGSDHVWLLSSGLQQVV